MKTLVAVVVRVLALPLLVVGHLSPARFVIAEDEEAWGRRMRDRVISPYSSSWAAYLMIRCPEFRSLMYFRLKSCGPLWHVSAIALGLVYRPQLSLYIDCPDVGSGLFFEHGFSTVINAKRIGKNCWINQQVTIGYGAAGDRPTLGDGVYVRAGAIVVGGVSIGDRAHVLAGAVVTRNVVADTRVAGVPARVRLARER